MAQDPELRAGDADRDRIITVVREAYAEGRLDADEFQQRMTQAQQARTFGDLDALVRDLPTAGSRPVGEPIPEATLTPVDDDAERRKLRSGWAAWAGVSLMVNVIWLGTWISRGGDAPGYWPIWVMGPWGVVMVIATINGRGR